MIKTFVSTDPKDIPEIAKEIIALSTHKVFTLIGDLGAGKTTLTQSLIKALNIDEPVTSPSFSIINEYHTDNHQVNHIDLYRLEQMEEALQIGIEDYLYSGNYTFIEWPQIINNLLPNKHHKIEILILDKLERRIIFS